MPEEDHLIILIVDAYSSGAQLSQRLHSHGVQLIHIQSSLDITDAFLNTYRSEDFIDEFIYGGSLDSLKSFLSNYQINQCVPGTETGVTLSDYICSHLHLPSHDPSLSEARRDKYLMLECLEASGIDHAHHHKVMSEDDLELWRGEFPSIFKPTDGAGSDSVFLCENKESLLKYYRAMSNSKGLLGHRYNEFVIEEYLKGEEYIVDMLHTPLGGQICHVASSRKSWVNGRPLYDYILLEDSEQPEIQQLLKYLKSALQALGFQYGPSHSELIQTANGPKLIETSGRLSGAGLPSLYEEISSNGSLASLVQLLLGSMDNTKNQHSMHCMVVFLMNSQVGQVHSLPEIESLGSFRSHAKLIFEPSLGEELVLTEDLFSSPGKIIFQAKNQEDLMRDWQLVRQNEKYFFQQILSK